MKHAIGRGFGFAIGLALARVIFALVFALLLTVSACVLMWAVANAEEEPTNVLQRYYCIAGDPPTDHNYFQAGQVWISGQQFDLYCEAVY